jgi:hypothetical protein
VSAATDTLQRWARDPVAYVREVFGVEPDDWQADALRAVATNTRVGMSACKGPGKSAVLAWCGWWFVSTRPLANVVAISITEANLRDGLWKELSLWLARPRAAWLRETFRQTAERITANEAPQSWWISARAFPQSADQTQQANTIAGIHGKHVLVLLDEMGDYPDGVLAAAEGVFANSGIDEAKIAAAWNPTRTEGPAYRVCTRDRQRWHIVHITGDPEHPKRSPRISIEWARQQIDDWGRDNDWVRVNVLGEFPRTVSDKLLGPDEVQAAMERDADPRGLEFEASAWGLDVARQGDDRSVLRERVGQVAFRPFVWRNLEGVPLAQRVAHILNESKRKPDYLFIDMTGGWGTSPYDHLKLLGWGDILVPVEFAGGADDEKYNNKRTEMWCRMAQWIKKGGCLPSDDAGLAGELTVPTYRYRASGKHTTFCLESKEEMRSRGIPSPDEADALACTFHTERLVKKSWDLRLDQRKNSHKMVTEYDSYAS